MVAVGLQFATYALDEGPNIVRFVAILGAPDRLEDLAMEQHFTSVARKIRQYLEFAPRQRDVLARQADAMGAKVNLQVAKVIGNQRSFWPRSHAAQQRPHTGQQLRNPKWLGEVVVRTEVQRAHAVRLAAACGDHEHRYLVVAADGLEHGQAVRSGKADVEQEQVQRVLRSELQCLRAVGGGGGVVAPPLESMRDEMA